MGIRVCKFGGSSVADAGQLRKVRAIVLDRDDRRYVVPSAPGKRSPDDVKITDLLYATQAAASRGEPIEPHVERIARRYAEIVADLGLPLDLDPTIAEIHDRIRDGADASYAASRGEYLSGLVLACLLGQADFASAAANGSGNPPLQAGTDSLSRYLRDHNVRFTGTVLGPVSVGVFRSDQYTAPVVVSLGQDLPQTKITLTDLRGHEAVFSYQEATQSLSLDLRR